MLWFWLAVTGAVAFGGGWIGTRTVLNALRRRAVLDHPTDRSSHSAPTPRGGGIAIMATLLLIWGVVAVAASARPTGIAIVLFAAVGLSALSFIDDLRGLPVITRLAAQVVAVAIGLTALPADMPVFQGLFQPTMDLLLTALLWLWFVNLFNFMDGIDGISGVEGAAVGIGVMLVALVGGIAPEWALYGVALAGAVLGFLRWNWPPAQVFMGDVGSVGIGFLGGWLLLSLAAYGQWVAALILPLYYLADATITLFRRLLRGERVWRAHRSHYYQRAAETLGSHGAVSLGIAATNVSLVCLAVSAAAAPGSRATALTLAIAVTAGLLWYFASRTDRQGEGE